MVLEDINLSIGVVKQVCVPIRDNSVVTLVQGEVGSRIWIRRIELSSDITAKFTIRSGSNIIFEKHYGQIGVQVNPWTGSPCFVANEGESLTIQSSKTSLDANVYLQYQLLRWEG
jgi:hypothetical protein